MRILCGVIMACKINVFIICLLILATVVVQPVLSLRDGLSKENIVSVKQYLEKLDSYDRNAWIDPNDMFAADSSSVNTLVHNADRSINMLPASAELAIKVVNKREVTTKKNDCDCTIKNTKNESAVHLYLTRWLNMFERQFSGTYLNNEKLISFPVNNEELKKLQSMLTSKELNFGVLDVIITNMLSSAIISDTYSWVDRAFFLFFETNFLLLSGAAFVILMCSYNLFFYPKTWSFLIMMGCSVAWEWKQMYQEELSKKHAKLEVINFRNACQREEIGIFDSIRIWFRGHFEDQGSCQDYYKAVMVDPIWEVTPMKAFSSTLVKFVLYPLEIAAETANKCIIKLFKDLSFTNMTIVVIFIFVILMMTYDYRLRGLFITFEPAPQQARLDQTQSVSMGRTILHKIQSLVEKITLPSSNNQEPIPVACECEKLHIQETEGIFANYLTSCDDNALISKTIRSMKSPNVSQTLSISKLAAVQPDDSDILFPGLKRSEIKSESTLNGEGSSTDMNDEAATTVHQTSEASVKSNTIKTSSLNFQETNARIEATNIKDSAINDIGLKNDVISSDKVENACQSRLVSNTSLLESNASRTSLPKSQESEMETDTKVTPVDTSACNASSSKSRNSPLFINS